MSNTYNTYFLKVKEADVPALKELAVLLNVLTKNGDEYFPAEGTTWDEIGPIYVAHSDATEGEDGEDGDTSLLPEAIKDEDGNPYWHANVRLQNVALMELAEAVAIVSPEIAAALEQIPRYFVAGEDGRATSPSAPARVFG